MTLYLLGVLVTLQWGPPCGLEGYYNLMMGNPVPSTQPKAQVQLNLFKTVLAAPCNHAFDLGAGSYVVALQSQNQASVPFESNRVAIIIYPDGSKWTDTPAPPIQGINSPGNFRFLSASPPPLPESEVPVSTVSFHSASANNPGQEGYLTLDKDNSTRWFIPSFPQHIIFDFGSSIKLSMLEYFESWSRIISYEIYVSNDPSNPGTIVKAGTMPADGKISFTPTIGRYLRLVAKSGGAAYAYATELSFRKMQ